MKTLTATFNQLVKQLKDTAIINEDGFDWKWNLEQTDVIEFLEKTFNQNFVNVLFGITKDGKLLTKQFEDSEEFMEFEFKDIVNNWQKENVIETLTKFLENENI